MEKSSGFYNIFSDIVLIYSEVDVGVAKYDVINLLSLIVFLVGCSCESHEIYIASTMH